MLKLEHNIKLSKDAIFSANLAGDFSKKDQSAIATRVWEGYEADEASRAMWKRRTNAAMQLALQVQTQKTFPWPGASSVVFPLVTIAALQFASESYPNIIQGTNVVRYRTATTDMVALQRAKRIGKHMSWQVLEQDLGWEEQHDRLLINLAIVGCNFIKSYYCPRRRYPVDELVLAQDLVIDYGARSVEDAARKTQMYTLHRNEIWEKGARGIYSDVRDEAWFQQAARIESKNTERDNRQGVVPTVMDDASRFTILEQHCFLDLDGDGYEEPYIATIEQSSRCLLRLVSRVDEEDEQVERAKSGRIICIRPTEYFTKFSFIPSSDNGIYDDGFGKLLGPINESVNSGINQLLDNGTLQNSIGGFLGRGAKIRGGVYTMVPWEWKRVDSTGDDLRKNLVPYPKSDPSPVMFQLLGLLIDYSNRISGTTDTQIGENPGQNTPASTYQGMQEQGKRVYRWIFKRVWRSMKEEFRKRYELNRRYTEFREHFGAGNEFIRAEDYRGSPDQVAPVANPNITSAMMRITQAMAVKQDAMMTPGYSVPDVTRNLLEALEVEGIDRLYPGPDKVPPLPNPKLQTEQLKLQSKQMQIEYEKWKLVTELKAESQESQARIDKLKAEAAQIISAIGADKAAKQLQLFDLVIKAMVAHNEALNSRIEALSGVEEGGQKDGGDQGGVRGLAGPPGNSGVQAQPPQMGGQPQGAMGGGNVPEGQPGGDMGGQLGGPV